MLNSKNTNSNDINFSLGDFNGPLDLLLELIKKKNVDIFEIDLVEVANQYLKIIEDLQAKNIDIASEYLVMASELIYIKAKLILADPEAIKEVEEDKMRLLQLLAEYQEFKQISQSLKYQEQQRKKVYIKKPSNLESFEQEVDPSILEGYGTTSKLIKVLRKMFERNYAEKLRKIKLETFNLSPSERREQIRALIDRNNWKIIPFEEIFYVPSLNHFVITLIAILDMSRKEELILEQKQQYDEIFIKKGVNY